MEFYFLFEQPRNSEDLGSWRKHLGDFNQVVGHSILGAIFLKSTKTNNYMVLYPLRAGSNSKNYGVFDSVTDFEARILKEPSFIEACLEPVSIGDIDILIKSLGRLGKEQVYFPVPHPSVGGSWDVETYDKGDFWIFADIACQNHGW